MAARALPKIANYYMYILADGAYTDDGWSAILPEGIDGEWLASPRSAVPGEFEKFALYKIPYIEPEQRLPTFEVVSEELSNLLSAAERYPPAMAIVRDQVNKVIEDRKEFSDLLIGRLRFHLEAQRDSTYLLARVIASDNRYKSIGSYYWIVGFSKAHRVTRNRVGVRWVSDDYFVYDDPLSDFDIDEAWLRERFKKTEGSSFPRGSPGG